MAKSPEVKAPSSGSVFIGCKLPHGLKLQLVRPSQEFEVGPAGAKNFTINRRDPESVYKLHGISLAQGQVPKFPIVNGAAITKVPADFWAKWLEQNKDHPAIKGQLVFVQSSFESIRSQSRELKEVKSGFEPINPDPAAKDPRMKNIRTVDLDNPDGEDEDSMVGMA